MSHYALYKSAHFTVGAAKLEQLPPDQGMEVAFAGRSNAGKSSVLNVLTQQNSLARTSKTPGRTQQINVFTLDDDRRLIDLPGYGYAKVPLAIKEEWQKTLDRYLQTRNALTGIVLIMDVRHPLKEFDKMMLKWSCSSGIPIHILLNKADKLKKMATSKSFLEVKKTLQPYAGIVSIQLFSALKKQGASECYQFLDKCLQLQE